MKQEKEKPNKKQEKRKTKEKDLALEIITIALDEKKRFVGSVEETLIGKYWRTRT